MWDNIERFAYLLARVVGILYSQFSSENLAHVISGDGRAKLDAALDLLVG